MLVKIVCAQLEILPGRPDLNFTRLLKIITTAKEAQADLLLLPEMCLPGYLIGDTWEQQSFLDDCNYYTEQLAAAADNLCILFGSVATEPGKLNEDGRIRKYNAAYVCQHGKFLGGYLGRNFIIKNSLPNYREFDDARYFYSLQKLCAEENAQVREALQPIKVEIRGRTLQLGVMLCEDGWTENYHLNVPQNLALNGAQLLCNLSASPYSLGKNKKRNRLFCKQAQAAGIPLLYVNHVGIQNNGKNIFTYDGCTSAYSSKGEAVTAAAMYADTLLTVYWNPDTGELNGENPPPALPKEPQSVYLALKYGTEKFLRQCGIKKMIIGLSGGIDSAVAAAMYVHILGAENVLLLNLPSRYNSAITQRLAQELAANLKTNYAIIPISESCRHTEAQLTSATIHNYGNGNEFQLQLSALAQENIQARDRGSRVLAAAAAAFGGAFSCNSNKAEIAVGYATFYGDICGLCAILGDLWKHQVYALGHYLNEEIFKYPVIPEAIFEIRPSAELSAEQTVGNGGDPLIYPYHDYLLRTFIENWHKTTPTEILRWYNIGPENLAHELGCEATVIKENFSDAAAFIEDLERWWRLVSGFAIAKRIQAPPILSISKRAYGYDHREAQLTPYFSREYLELKAKLLQKTPS